ncbi:MAG: helix-turn-helix domain-containing protein [Verrucomicrobiales bacterium]
MNNTPLSEGLKGRPSSFTPETAQRVLEAVEKGLTYKQAAAYAGISYTTLNRWRLAGESDDGEPHFRKFWKSLQQANGHAAFRLIGHIEGAAKRGDWKAAGWIMERRFRDEWGSKGGNFNDPLEPLYPL